MIRQRLVLVLVILALVGLPSCAERSPQELINSYDHSGLANYYAEQAQGFRQQAQEWESYATFYERHAQGIDSREALSAKRHAAHCRAIAQSYKKAAEEAEALKDEHRNQVQPARD